MSKMVWYIAVLIGIFILVAYYKGTASVGGTLFSGTSTLVQTLQGRNSQGQLAAYPT